MREYMSGKISSSEYFRAVRSVTGSGSPTIKRTGSDGGDGRTKS
jgi:hypothetical protein